MLFWMGLIVGLFLGFVADLLIIALLASSDGRNAAKTNKRKK